MTSTFHIDLPNWQQETVPLRVIAELSHPEPDVGIRGDGSVAVEIISVIYQDADITADLSEDRIEDIAHIIYDRLEQCQ